MAEHRAVRMGIDVGGTYTKCVAMDNATHEIIGKNEVKTTHDDKAGVAAGVVQSFKNCMAENGISPEDVVFVAHSTTQATNAFIEGDVAPVGVIGVAGRRPGRLSGQAAADAEGHHPGRKSRPQDPRLQRVHQEKAAQ